MQIKLDENIPETAAPGLIALGHNVDTVVIEGLTGRPDADVWAATQQAARFLITQDLDFSDIRKFTPGTHRGLLLLRLRIPSRIAIESYLAALFRTEKVEDWALNGAMASSTGRTFSTSSVPMFVSMARWSSFGSTCSLQPGRHSNRRRLPRARIRAGCRASRNAALVDQDGTEPVK
jgi:predicted nuclease of predicted toxin-antitoxin system